MSVGDLGESAAGVEVDESSGKSRFMCCFHRDKFIILIAIFVYFHVDGDEWSSIEDIIIVKKHQQIIR